MRNQDGSLSGRCRDRPGKGEERLLCESVWAATTQYHLLGDINNRGSFLTVLEAEKSMTQ